MTKYETPRDAEGRRLCQHCLTKPVRESLGRKPWIYCSRNCRQRAYEARKNREAMIASVAAAVLRDRKSRDVPGPSTDAPAKSRDFSKSQAAPGIPAPAVPTSPPPVPPAEPVLPSAWRANAAPAPVPRRALSRRRGGMTASPMPLWSDVDGQERPDEPPTTKPR